MFFCHHSFICRICLHIDCWWMKSTIVETLVKCQSGNTDNISWNSNNSWHYIEYGQKR